MAWLRKTVLFSTAVILGTLPADGFAQSAEVAALQSEMMELNRKLKAVEDRLAQIATEQPSPAVYVQPDNETGKWLGDIQFGGYMDVQYNQNFSQSGDTVAGGNTGRLFDNNRDSFTVNATEVNLTKTPNPDGGAGFRADFAYGEDAAIVNADGDGDRVNLQQAYIEYLMPLRFWEGNDVLPSSIDFKAGRFVTLAGAEVIEGPDNWNISRSYAFGLTIPFVHTGLRSNFKLFRDFFDVYLGVNNGWDNPVDNNTYKTLEHGLGYKILENVAAFHSLYWGPETAGTNAHRRFLLSNVLKWDATEKLAFMGEVNFGNERRALSTPDLDNVQWHSYNFYTRYQLTDRWALAYRGELFRDQEEFRSGLDRTLWEQTLTAEYAITDDLIGRLEYRWDKADNEGVFKSDSSQQTIAAQMLYLFS